MKKPIFLAGMKGGSIRLPSIQLNMMKDCINHINTEKKDSSIKVKTYQQLKKIQINKKAKQMKNDFLRIKYALTSSSP